MQVFTVNCHLWDKLERKGFCYVIDVIAQHLKMHTPASVLINEQFVVYLFQCLFGENGLIFGYLNGHLCVGYNVCTLGDLSKAPLPKEGLNLVAGGQQGSFIYREVVCSKTKRAERRIRTWHEFACCRFQRDTDNKTHNSTSTYVTQGRYSIHWCSYIRTWFNKLD